MNARRILSIPESATRRPVYLTTEEWEADIERLRDVDRWEIPVPDAMAYRAIADRHTPVSSVISAQSRYASRAGSM